MVVEHFVGAQCLDKLEISRRAGCQDSAAREARKLQPEQTRRCGTATDQHSRDRRLRVLKNFKSTIIDVYSDSRYYDPNVFVGTENDGRHVPNVVRRSERSEEEEEEEDVREVAVLDARDEGRSFEAEKLKKDRRWTQITKDVVNEEAIKEEGYVFEKTDDSYCVMEYLRYVSTGFLLPPIKQIFSS